MLTVAGIGNRHFGDDAVGLYLLEDIWDQPAGHVHLLLWEDMDALSIASELLAIDNPIIIVDCADMGLETGEYKWLDADECRLLQHFGVVSTHGLGFSDALALVQQLGFNQPLSFFVVQPELLSQQTGLGPILAARMELLSKALLARINNLAGNGADSVP